MKVQTSSKKGRRLPSDPYMNGPVKKRSLAISSNAPEGASAGARSRRFQVVPGFRRFQVVPGSRRFQGERIKHLKHRQLFNEHEFIE